MLPNPLLGILLHAIGGFAAGSFYAPLKKVERWAWESFWLVMGLAAWLAAPWIVALITIPRSVECLGRQSRTCVGTVPAVRHVVGAGKPDVRSVRAVPGHGAGLRGGPGILHGRRHADAADLWKAGLSRSFPQPAG